MRRNRCYCRCPCPLILLLVQWLRRRVHVSDFCKELLDDGGVAEVEDLEFFAPDDGDEASEVRDGGLLDSQPPETAAHFGNPSGFRLVAGQQHLDAQVRDGGGSPDVQRFQMRTG